MQRETQIKSPQKPQVVPVWLCTSMTDYASKLSGMSHLRLHLYLYTYRSHIVAVMHCTNTYNKVFARIALALLVMLVAVTCRAVSLPVEKPRLQSVEDIEPVTNGGRPTLQLPHVPNLSRAYTLIQVWGPSKRLDG